MIKLRHTRYEKFEKRTRVMMTHIARDDDTNQTNVHRCTRSIQIYRRLTHL